MRGGPAAALPAGASRCVGTCRCAASKGLIKSGVQAADTSPRTLMPACDSHAYTCSPMRGGARHTATLRSARKMFRRRWYVEEPLIVVMAVLLAEQAQSICDCLCCHGGTCNPTVVGVAANRTACSEAFAAQCGACGPFSSPGVCAPVCELPPLPLGASRFNYTGSAQTYVVPAGVRTVNITAAGSEGGPAHNGFLPAKGGVSTAQISVQPGQTLQVYVGGPGCEADTFGTARGGFNGGGAGQSGTSGGGGSDVRTSDSIDNRLIVAGGGAGSPFSGGVGGAGGGDTGQDGEAGWNGNKGGGGGGQTTGGSCGHGDTGNCAGTAGKGGDCPETSTLQHVPTCSYCFCETVLLKLLTICNYVAGAAFFCSGGGGGWYGGGTSGDGTQATAGGGSGYVLPGAHGTTTLGAHAGAGYVDIVPITRLVCVHGCLQSTVRVPCDSFDRPMCYCCGALNVLSHRRPLRPAHHRPLPGVRKCSRSFATRTGDKAQHSVGCVRGPTSSRRERQDARTR